MLEVRDITFARGGRPILSGASLCAETGTITALVGANGAGKTTFLRILAGTLLPDGGSVRADGFDALGDPLRFRRVMGYLPENAPADSDLTVRDYLTFRARLKGEQQRKIRHRVAEAAEACALTDCLATRIGRLSNGYVRRVALAEALLLRPRFLFADDLFAGLDDAARAHLRDVLTTFAQVSAVVITGHELDDFARFVTRVAVLKGGTVTPVGDMAAARREMAS